VLLNLQTAQTERTIFLEISPIKSIRRRSTGERLTILHQICTLEDTEPRVAHHDSLKGTPVFGATALASIVRVADPDGQDGPVPGLRLEGQAQTADPYACPGLEGELGFLVDLRVAGRTAFRHLQAIPASLACVGADERLDPNLPASAVLGDRADDGRRRVGDGNAHRTGLSLRISVKMAPGHGLGALPRRMGMTAGGDIHVRGSDIRTVLPHDDRGNRGARP